MLSLSQWLTCCICRNGLHVDRVTMVYMSLWQWFTCYLCHNGLHVVCDTMVLAYMSVP